MHSLKARLPSNQPLSKSDAQKNYAVYAKNINVNFLSCDFNNKPGNKVPVHGDKKSIKSAKGHVTFHSKTMITTDGKYKVYVFRGPGEKWVQDSFEVELPTPEEVLKVMLERATGLDAAGNKVEITE